MPPGAIIKFRRDTPENWTAVNPVLAAAEPGVEIGTHQFKLGDGATAWNDLPYAGGGGGADPATITAAVNAYLAANPPAGGPADVTASFPSPVNDWVINHSTGVVGEVTAYRLDGTVISTLDIVQNDTNTTHLTWAVPVAGSVRIKF